MPRPLDLLFLGSGNGFSSANRYWSSFLAAGRILFDAAPTVLPHLKRAEISANDIDVIFISHFHADHLFGLPFLFLEYNKLSDRRRDLAIVGPLGVEERVRTITTAGMPHNLDDLAYRVEFREVTDGAKGEVAGVRYLAREVDHVPDFPCFGYRVEIEGRALAYSGDSKLCDALVDLATGADVFVVECSIWHDGDPGPHMNPNDVRELRRRLGPTPRFILTHLDPGERDLGIENAVYASDLARIPL
jgi:ribonuclease BN (tRNA processing enzyme)